MLSACLHALTSSQVVASFCAAYRFVWSAMSWVQPVPQIWMKKSYGWLSGSEIFFGPGTGVKMCWGKVEKIDTFSVVEIRWQDGGRILRSDAAWWRIRRHAWHWKNSKLSKSPSTWPSSNQSSSKLHQNSWSSASVLGLGQFVALPCFCEYLQYNCCCYNAILAKTLLKF